MAVSNADGTSPVKVFADPATHRLLVSATGGGTGTVTNVSVVSANGFAGTVANPTTTPAITVSTSINSPVLAGNGTALSAATTTGSGSTVVLSNTPTLVTPIIGAATGTSLALGGGTALTTTNQTGTENLVLATAPTMSNPVVGTQTSSDNSTKAASTATASTLVARDSNANISGNNNIQGFTTTATAAGTTTLTVGSTYQQYFTGSTTQTVTLPVATTMVNGQQFFIANNSTGLVTVQTSGANSLIVLAASTFAFVTCINTAGGTGTASWNAEYRGVNITSGKVLAVTNTITLSGTDATTMTFPSTTQTVAGLTSTQTFTNKRVSRRVVTTTQSATPTINTDNTDVAAITGLAQAVTSFTTNLSGTPVAGDFLEIQVTDNGTARALTFGASFAASTVALPTTTVISTLLHILFEWDTTSSKWILVATA